MLGHGTQQNAEAGAGIVLQLVATTGLGHRSGARQESGKIESEKRRRYESNESEGAEAFADVG
jgi:hypothetical protein